jgi:hypothetical protein
VPAAVNAALRRTFCNVERYRQAAQPVRPIVKETCFPEALSGTSHGGNTSLRTIWPTFPAASDSLPATHSLTPETRRARCNAAPCFFVSGYCDSAGRLMLERLQPWRHGIAAEAAPTVTFMRHGESIVANGQALRQSLQTPWTSRVCAWGRKPRALAWDSIRSATRSSHTS